jgi:hypothetical protein
MGALFGAKKKKIIFLVNFDPHCIPTAWKGEIMTANG